MSLQNREEETEGCGSTCLGRPKQKGRRLPCPAPQEGEGKNLKASDHQRFRTSGWQGNKLQLHHPAVSVPFGVTVQLEPLCHSKVGHGLPTPALTCASPVLHLPWSHVPSYRSQPLVTSGCCWLCPVSHRWASRAH